MPTFSFQSGNGVVASSSAVAAPTVAPTVEPKKKSRNTKKPVKAESQTDQPIVEHSDSACACIVDEPTAQHIQEEQEEVRHEPTFPDIVILKQNDKNYIVKHNHYPVSGNEKKPNEDTTVGGPNTEETESLLQTSDLVSPNQIYKGQINKKRGRKPKAGFILNSNSGI
jgi:hypothetical protein